jgi:N-acetylmuramoyl-L-alanine amidase
MGEALFRLGSHREARPSLFATYAAKILLAENDGKPMTARNALGAPASRADELASDVDRFDRVVLDAGPGGDEHGAEGPAGLLEKELVLDVARRLKARIEGDGVQVVLTRDDDVYVPLDERTAIANRGRRSLRVGPRQRRSRGARGVGSSSSHSRRATNPRACRRARERRLPRGVARVARRPAASISATSPRRPVA